MKILTATTSRLGDRSSNQDRCLMERKTEHILLVVADGMGGHARGDLAAQISVDSLARSFRRERTPILEPQAFLKQALCTAHLDVVDAGRSHNPPITPRTTCVVCLIHNDTAHWAHVGDSRLYLLRDGALLQRTRDHTPVEELLQSGLVSEEELRTHPLRNSVNRCLGGPPRFPEISFGQATLHSADTLLLCSDGLWSAIPEARLIALTDQEDLEPGLNQLADEAESASYPNSDNISGIVLRWFTAHAVQPASDQNTPETDVRPPEQAKGKDQLEQAIEDIHRAMLEYAAEMKK